MDTETGIMKSLLKEKAKELKSTQKKLKKVEEKYVEVHRSNKGLLSDHETFIQFLHLVFPPQHLEELLLPADQYGLYDLEHLRGFWTLLKSQMQSENSGIYEVMREEKAMLMEKIKTYESTMSEMTD